MIVLDTNVVSELMRPRPSADVIEWVARQAAPTQYFTTISEAELRYGVEILPTGRRRERLLAEIEGMLRKDFAGRILPFDREAAHVYAVIAAERRAAGHPISHADCQIAAVARSMRGSVRNEKCKRLRRVRHRRVQPLERQDSVPLRETPGSRQAPHEASRQRRDPPGGSYLFPRLHHYRVFPLLPRLSLSVSVRPIV